MKDNHFFITGVMRSGTTYLATILDEHPDICMAKPILPEPKFFLKEEEYSKGLEYYESKYFDKTGNSRIFGEKTVHYCEREDAAKRIKQFFPDCRIILILRNPVYRAFSNYYFSLKNGLETRGIEEVFLEDVPPPEYDESVLYISPFDYLRRGEYINQIKLYERYFNRERMKIIIMENLVGSREQIAQLYQFLGVDDSFIPPSIDKKIFSNEVDLSRVNPDIIERLREYYVEHNILLEEHLKIDLSVNLSVWM